MDEKIFQVPPGYKASWRQRILSVVIPLIIFLICVYGLLAGWGR